MPSTLFAQPSGAHRNRTPFGTVSLSVAVHVAAIAAIVTLQLTTGLGGPQVISHLRAFAAPADPPIPEPPAPIRPASAAPRDVNPTAPPIEAPSSIAPEPAELPVVAGPGVPANWLGGPTTTLSAPPAVPTPTPAPRVDKPTGPVPVGGAIRPPERVTYVAPKYPDVARLARVEGQVVLEATIDEWGAVTNIVVRRSVPLLDRAAIDAVSKWRYAPTRLNNQPIAVVMMVTVTFRLQQ
jgi:protein TonB